MNIATTNQWDDSEHEATSIVALTSSRPPPDDRTISHVKRRMARLQKARTMIVESPRYQPQSIYRCDCTRLQETHPNSGCMPVSRPLLWHGECRYFDESRNRDVREIGSWAKSLTSSTSPSLCPRSVSSISVGQSRSSHVVPGVWRCVCRRSSGTPRQHPTNDDMIRFPGGPSRGRFGNAWICI